MKQSYALAIALGLLAPVFQLSVRGADTNSEASLISVLQSDSSLREKDDACARLKQIGTARCVPALSALLPGEHLSDSARHALESLPEPKAERALIEALAKTSGLTQMGIINSLGVRKEPQALEPLAKLLFNPDADIACASAAALGEIAGPQALDALQKAAGHTTGTVHDAIVDACLDCANQLLASGNQTLALAVFQKIYQTESKDYVQTAAYRGMIRAGGERGLELMSKAITGEPGPAQLAAIQMAHEVKIPGATKALTALLPKADSRMQIDLLAALSQRNDPSAAPAVATLVHSDQPGVRLAAIEALGTLGNGSDVEMLIESAVNGSGAERAAARRSLSLLHRGDPAKALVALLSNTRLDLQAEAARALGERGDTVAVPALMKLAEQAPDTARKAALKALPLLVDQPQLNSMVQMVVQAKDESSRTEAAKALDLACLHIHERHGKVDLEPLVKVLTQSDTDTRIALLPACSGFADPQLRTALRSCMADSNPQIHEAAIRALCNTVDPDLLPDLVKVAREPSTESFRHQAIAACVRITTQEENVNVPNAERMKVFRAILLVAENADQKRLVLAGLAKTPDAAALDLAEPLLDNADVRNEAAWAVIKISNALPDPQPGIAALKKVLAQTSDAMIKETAQTDLNQLQINTDYITDWQAAGPYRQKGKNYTDLFDIPFPPENGEGNGAQWKIMPKSTDPKQPWLMDLLRTFGGENRVAYARTWVYSDEERPARLELGSDDGVKAWLNGKVVHAINVARGLQVGSDKVTVTLKKGWNRLLLKVTQANAGWAFCARFVSPDGLHLDGMRFAASSEEPK